MTQYRTALVTGASRGIGAAIAKTLAGHGVRVALVARSREPLEALQHELGENAIARPCDVTNEAEVAQLAKQVTKIFDGPPDVIVNNAGIFRLSMLESMPAELLASTLSSNVMAPFFVLQAFLPAMRQRGTGHIVTIGSVADRMVMPENGAYAASKYALRAMHEVLRLELRGSGVRATLVSPAATDTPLWDSVLDESHQRQLPSRDMMLSADAVAEAVLYSISQPPSVNVDELRLSHS